MFVVPDFKLCFLFNINVFLQKKLKTPIFGQEGGCNKTGFHNLCFAKYYHFPIVCQILVEAQKLL